MFQKTKKFKEGGIYHLIKRGVGRQEVFQDKRDYSRFSLDLEFCNNQRQVNLWDIVADETKVRSELTMPERIKEARKEKGDPLVKLLAFTLMPTHAHLVVEEIIEDGISGFMRKLGGYTTYFNQRHDRGGGSLFRRYKAVPVKTDSQLSIVFTYVHTNPLSLWEPGWKQYQVENKEKALKKLEDYTWSTYPCYIGKNRFLNSIERELFLNFFGSEQECKQAIEDWVDYKAAEEEIEAEILE